jgi:hypothetical protein
MGAATPIRRELLGLARLLTMRRHSDRHHCFNRIVTLHVLDSALTNGLDQKLYLRTVLAQTLDRPISSIEELLPWNLALPIQTQSSQAA